MDFDLTDPLTLSFQEEHQSDTDIADLFASEADHMHSRNFFSRLKNRDSYVSFRSEAISLVLQAQFSCDFDPFISYLAINYMDRYFVSKQEIPQGKPWFSRLIIIACLSIAAKMKNFPISLSDIQVDIELEFYTICNKLKLTEKKLCLLFIKIMKQREEEGFIFDAKTVHKMELLILDALSWRMRSITPFSFLAFFMSFFELNDHPLTQALKDRTSEIIFSSQNDIKFSEFKPSVIAASALLSASHELFPLQFPSFKASLSDCQYVKRENLLKCFNQMQEMVAMMQVYSSNCDTFSTIKTPMSVLERNKFASSESDNSSTVTSTAQCDTIISEKEDNKRRKLNGPCNRFKISKFCHY